MQPAIEVRDLHKSYGDFEAVGGIDFEVAQGEVFGLLGPNGAGKTSTVEILEGLRPRTSGDVRVLGFDPAVEVRSLKDRIGVCLQSTNLPEKVTVIESLEWFAAFYSRRGDLNKLLERLQLTEKRNAYYSSLSGGQKQRVALALALVNEPQLIFLDEPTTGLDPQVRLEIHSLISELRADKRTILMTTHYIEEAERLCDRVAIVDQGRIIAMGTPREIQARTLDQSRIEIRTLQPMPEGAPEFEGGQKLAWADNRTSLILYSAKPARTLPDLLRWVDASGVELEDIQLKKPTLEDVFIELTGEKAEGLVMNAYLAQIRMNLLLTRRDRMALFFQLVFPLIFFFIFGATMRAEQGGAGAAQVVNMVLTIGILGSGFFGAGIRAVVEREQNILRRFKVAPIGPGPILVASLVTGLITFLPLVVLVLVLSHVLYGMPYPERLGSLLIFISIGVVAFRSMGSMIASVANSMQESQILIQILYFPMLFLGGATFPISLMPNWLQITSQFLPSTYLTGGLQGILRGRDGILDSLPAVGALLLTAAVATFLGMKLFRWEKEEKLKPAAKLWLLVVMAPFFLMGAWQSQAKDNLAKSKRDERDVRRGRTWLIRDARLFLGNGQVIEQGSVLVRDGKIAEIFTGPAPDAKSLKAEPIEAAGKTLLPGLIDAHVHLGSPGGFFEKQEDYEKQQQGSMDRELAAYLYSGVIAVKSTGDALDDVLKLRAKIASGEALGAELFLVGPMFTAPGGHGTEYTRYLPESMRATLEQQLVRLPQNAIEARTQVEELKKRGVDGIKTILETGAGNVHYNRLDTAVFQAIVDAARANGLPVVSHTGDAQDVGDAVAAHVDGIEHGSFRDAIPDTVFARMKQQGIAYDPTLMVVDALTAFGRGDASGLDRSLLQQTAPPELLQATKRMVGSAQLAEMRAAYAKFPMSLEDGMKNLLAAERAGVMLVAGTDAGNPLVFHGPGIHREMQLWVKAGVPPSEALQAATYNNARLLRVDNRIGLIQKGYEASLLLIDGNPLQDISATEHIAMVLFKGERVDRSDLFK